MLWTAASDGTSINVRLAARTCADDSNELHILACLALAKGASIHELLSLRAEHDEDIEIALMRAACLAPAVEANLRPLFREPPREPAIQKVLRALTVQPIEAGGYIDDIGPHPLPGNVAFLDVDGAAASSLALALLCREGCPTYRRRLEEGLWTWLEFDWFHATVAAASLGLMGSAESENVLLAALLQKRSWMLTIVSARALGRSRGRTERATDALKFVSQNHWSTQVRAATSAVLNGNLLGADYQQVSVAVASSNLSYYSLAFDLEPVLDSPSPIPWRHGGIGREDVGELRCEKVTAMAESSLTELAPLEFNLLTPSSLARLWLPAQTRERRGRIADSQALAPYVLVRPSYGTYLASGDLTVVFIHCPTCPKALWPVAEIPGNAIAAKVSQDRKLLLLTNAAGVAVGKDGVERSLCR